MGIQVCVTGDVAIERSEYFFIDWTLDSMGFNVTLQNTRTNVTIIDSTSEYYVHIHVYNVNYNV